MDEIERLAQRLMNGGYRIVFAESCTAGLASALLATTPGISAHLCGSWVTYRDECKQAWLGVPSKLLREESAVSADVTAWMAREALRRTESAHFAAAITGHLGPDAPPNLDGVCFMAIAARNGSSVQVLDHRRCQLKPSSRTDRQQAAARHLLQFASDSLPVTDAGLP